MRPESETLLSWLKPEPMTPEQEKGLEVLKPGDYEVYNETLNSYLLEAREIFPRLGVSSMMRSGDLIVAIYTATGDLACGSCGTYLHTIAGTLVVKFIAKNWLNDPTVGINDGDVFYCCEPLYGGIHNPDQIAVMPVFNDGELIAWVCAAVHAHDTGGVDPGGYTTGAKSRCWEGMRLTPIKVGSNFRLHNDMIEMMENMVTRDMRAQNIDVRARAATADRLRRRVQELAQKKGNTFVHGLMRRQIIQSENGAKKKFSNWNDGIYRHVCFFDTSGSDTCLLRIFCTVTKKGEHITFDFTGTSPEHDGGAVHSRPHIVAAHLAVYLFGNAFHDLPVSIGAYTPIDFIVPQGTYYNPDPMAPLCNAPPATMPVFDIAYKVFAKMMFDSTDRHLVHAGLADNAGAVCAGVNQWGITVADMLTYCFNASGSGGRYDDDGVDAFGFPWCFVGKGADAEDAENVFPLLQLWQGFVKDSCGLGKYRGGSGVSVAYIVHGADYCTEVAVTPGTKFFNAQPLFGGYPARPRPWVRVRNTDIWDKMKQNSKDIPKDIWELVTKRSIKGDYEFEHYMHLPHLVNNGDIFVDISCGEAGYGDVLERDPETVMEDIRRQIISHNVAQKICFVAYDPETLIVDQTETKELRQKERERRKSRGKSYSDFMKEWSQKRPPEEALIHYGSWPYAEKVREIVRL